MTLAIVALVLLTGCYKPYVRCEAVNPEVVGDTGYERVSVVCERYWLM